MLLCRIYLQTCMPYCPILTIQYGRGTRALRVYDTDVGIVSEYALKILKTYEKG